MRTRPAFRAERLTLRSSKGIALTAGRVCRALALCLAACAIPLTPVAAHPHVFVDGKIDFVMREGSVLEAVEVTWLFDEFETLVMLASSGLSLNADGDLENTDRQEVARLQSDWPGQVGSSVHLSMGDAPLTLGEPSGVDVRMLDGRLAVTFTRHLRTPVSLAAHTVEAALYEPTFFVSFSIAELSGLLGAPGSCATQLHRFEPDPEDERLFAVLALLSREETPDIENVGAQFADRITLRCE